MALYKSKQATGTKPVATPDDSLLGRVLYEYSTTASLVSGDIIDLGPLPADVYPTDVVLISEDLDTNNSPTITLSVGILTSAKDDLSGTAFIVDSTVAQAGGLVRAVTNTCYLLGTSSSERRLGIKVTASAATGTGATAKKIAVILEVAA